MLRVEVIADSSGKWVGNGMTFDNVEDAIIYAQNLHSRWTLVQDWRVVGPLGDTRFRMGDQR